MYLSLKDHLGAYLCASLRFRTLAWEQTTGLRILYGALGAPEHILPALIESVLCFQDGVFWCASSMEGDPRLLTRIEAALSACWRFRTFSESRRLGFGSCCRSLLLGLLLGLHDQRRFILESLGDDCAYYGKGCARLYEEENAPIRPMAIGVFAAYAPDSVLLELPADDRILRPNRIEELRSVFSSKWTFVADIPFYSWHLVGQMCGWTATTIRSQVFVAIAAASAYLERFWHVYETTWSYVCFRDPELAVYKLLTMPSPPSDDGCSLQAWSLLQHKADPEMIVQAFAVAGRWPCSINSVEQGHRCQAWLQKIHGKALSAHQLVVRGCLAQLRTLYSPPCLKLHSRQCRLEQVHLRLGAKKPPRMSSASVFMSDFFGETRTELDRRGCKGSFRTTKLGMCVGVEKFSGLFF